MQSGHTKFNKKYVGPTANKSGRKKHASWSL